MGDGASFRKQITSIFRHRMGTEMKNSEYDDLLEKSNIVGAIHRKREEKEIIEILMKEPAGENGVPPVVAITGIAGIGKTTLALLVCEDDNVKGRFGWPIWLNAAGKTFDDLASIAGPVKAAATSSGNPSLLVLDDLRAEISKSKVSELRKHGVSVGAGAIIVTTRRTWQSFDDKAMHVFPLKGLDEEQSWSLFTSLGSSNKHKEEIKEILHNCLGVPPLATKLVSKFRESRAGTLEKDKLSEWLQFCLQPLAVQLVAYLSLFPDDYLIHADRLIHLWIAEGFVPPEESWRRVIDDFVASGIFQDVKREEGGDGVVKSCRVHPYVQELARFVAKKKKDEFISTGVEEEPLLRASFDMRLVDSVSKLELFLKEEKRAKGLRTILFHGMVESPLVLGNQQAERMNEYTCDKVLSTCKALCVLDLQHLGMNMVPSSIGKLKDLTYLDLSHNNFEKLPNSITKLSQLKTLKLSRCHLLKELPKDLKDLTKLTHLHIDGCVNIQSMPRGINNLTSLQTLSNFVVGKNEPMASEELRNLNELRGHLEIMYPERLKFQGSSSEWMNKKEHLRRLTFRLDQHDKGNEQDQEKALQALKPHTNLTELHVVGYKGNNFPSWIPSLHCLVKLSLYNCSTSEPLPGLDELRSLEVLELRRMHSLRFVAEKYDESVHPFFPSLKKLTLWDCPKLESWWRIDNNTTDGESKKSIIFSCISSLQIQYCPNLTRMPLYPTLDKMLELVESSVEPVWDTIRYGESKTAKEAEVVPFSNLKCMFIASIQKSPPEQWLVNFTSLEKLHIRDCLQLEALPLGFKHLSSLQSLTIETCPVLDLDRSPDEWKDLENLNSLIIREIPKLKSLPMGLEKVKSLREIRLHDCAGLTSLPEKIENITSLVRLEICQCENLASLPKGIEKLKSLDTLIIRDCPLLMPRCQPDTGNDWPKIAHVKNIVVKQTSQRLWAGKLRM
ncbi:putative disease resistance RPP13-like protein 1 [Arachis stenosperma]|uniref:putative disease resistance RPP13-like protein 1 n=1 Tax=Arachis stenosperma TaxID=217475 RepID=UPI0025ABB635|nr:putative disease resistance RPP13-like protein 1 [Arachis stenosperma]